MTSRAQVRIEVGTALDRWALHQRQFFQQGTTPATAPKTSQNRPLPPLPPARRTVARS